MATACAVLSVAGCGSESSQPAPAPVPDCDPTEIGCLPVGVPPEACAEGFEPVLGGCEPILPEAPCPAGEMAVPGDTECRPVGECGDSRWGQAPIGPDTQFVDGAYTGGMSDGSESHPWTTVQQGVEAAAPGSVVAIAAGSYPESVAILDKAVHLWGRCPEQVQVGAQLGVGLENASGTEVHGLAIVATDYSGIMVDDSEDVVLEDLWIHDFPKPGVLVTDSYGPASVTLRNTLIEGTSVVGAQVYGAGLTMERVAIRDVAIDPVSEGGFGIGAFSSIVTEEPATLEVIRSVVERSALINLLAQGAVATVDASVLRDVPEGTNLFSTPSLDGTVAGDVTVRRSVLTGHGRDGAILREARLAIEDSVIGPAGDPVDTLSGYGVLVITYRPEVVPELRVARTLLTDNIGQGVLALGGTVSLDQVWIRGTAAKANGIAGDGVTLGWNDVPALGDIQRSRIEGSERAGIAIFGTSLTLGSTELECNTIQLDGEPFGGQSFAIDNLGGNACGCGPESETCKVVSAQLEPPEAPEL